MEPSPCSCQLCVCIKPQGGTSTWFVLRNAKVRANLREPDTPSLLNARVAVGPIRALELKQRAPLATSSQRAASCLYKMSGTRLSGRALSSRRGTGDETWLARAAARLLRCVKHSSKGASP